MADEDDDTDAIADAEAYADAWTNCALTRFELYD